jgi:hypothetical protein
MASGGAPDGMTRCGLRSAVPVKARQDRLLWWCGSYRFRDRLPTQSHLMRRRAGLVVPVVETSGVQCSDGRVGQVEPAGAVECLFGGAGG